MKLCPPITPRKSLKRAVPALPKKLPPWSADKEPEYAAGLDPLIAALYRTDTPLERLEAYLPLFIDHSPESKRQPTIDRVRMVYLKNAVSAPNPNLVLIVFSYYSGYQIRQNGAGSGPPGDGLVADRPPSPRRRG